MALDLPLLVPAIRLDRDDGTEEATALRRAQQPWVAGFILFGGEAEQVARLTAQLREAAGRPIFIGSDMERGAGQQVRGLTRLPDAGIVGMGGTPDDAAALGALTAREARSVGIDVIFAPCVDVRSEIDNPILGNRSYGFDPHRVGVLGASFAAGVSMAGALPVAKHFPGHGATSEDSHETMPVVHAPRHELEMRDLAPFERLLGIGEVPAIMTAHVAYPALDESGTIATFSELIVERARSYVLEGMPDLLVFTDAMIMAGALVEGGEVEAARRALGAGCDALLYPAEPEAVAEALAMADHVLRAPMDRAAGHMATFLERLAAAEDELQRFMPEMDDAAPMRVARRAVRMALGTNSWEWPSCLVVIDDDGIEDRGRVLAGHAEAHRPVHLLRVTDNPAEELAKLHRPRGNESWTIVVMASARGWKGASGVSPACLEMVDNIQAWLERDIHATSKVLWCTPRGVGALGAHIPGSGPHLEEALAEVFFADDEAIDEEGFLPVEAGEGDA